MNHTTPARHGNRLLTFFFIVLIIIFLFSCEKKEITVFDIGNYAHDKFGESYSKALECLIKHSDSSKYYEGMMDAFLEIESEIVRHQ